jgi:hypothetical protein
MNRVALVTSFALLVAAPVASAGPIEWDYSAHVRTRTGTGVLNLGTFNLGVDPSGNGSAEPVFSDYTYLADFPERTLTGDFRSLTGGTNDFRLFTVPEFPAYPRAEIAPTGPTDSSFLVSLTLTDRASGQSGTVELEGSASVIAGPELNSPKLFSLTLGPATTELVLGGNGYRVRGIGGLPDELEEPASAYIGVDVTAAAAVQTPEPATLALAAVGLAAVGVRRGRKRR